MLERPFDWRVACLRVERLVQAARGDAELARAREETETPAALLDEERRERTWRDHFDPLTGLPASERLERTLANALATATPTSQVAVALLDIEKLVLINNRLGRAPRELGAAAGGAAADHRAPLRRGAPAGRGTVALHGRPRSAAASSR